MSIHCRLSRGKCSSVLKGFLKLTFVDELERAIQYVYRGITLAPDQPDYSQLQLGDPPEAKQDMQFMNFSPIRAICSLLLLELSADKFESSVEPFGHSENC